MPEPFGPISEVRECVRSEKDTPLRMSESAYFEQTFTARSTSHDDIFS